MQNDYNKVVYFKYRQNPNQEDVSNYDEDIEYLITPFKAQYESNIHSNR